MFKEFDRTKVFYFLLIASLVGLFLYFSYSRAFDEFENSAIDFRLKLRPHQDVSDDIVIIEIGDDSIEKLGKWPFPRNYHALLTNALKHSGVKTIVFDIFFSEGKKEDEEFARAIREAGNVYMPHVFELDRENPDRSRLCATGFAARLIEVYKKPAKGVGFINVVPEIDGKIRRVPPFVEYEGVYHPHITVLAVLNNLGYSFSDVKIIPQKSFIVSEDLVIPLDENSSILVNYPDVWGKAFRHYSYIDILQSYLADVTGQEPIVDLSELKDTVCFIGLTATASPDAHPSPMEPLYPGVGVHTSLYNSVLNKSLLVRLNRWWNLLILIMLWVLTAFVTSRSRKRFVIPFIVLLMVSFVSAAVLLFCFAGIWIDVFYPVVTVAAVYVVFAFKKYVGEIQKREILEKELDIAKNIQQSFLPREIPEVGGIKIGVEMLTARQVGGDLYDIVQLDEDRLGVMLGDVSGKGVPAALYMARVVSVFKTYVRKGAVAEVVKKVNERLVDEGGSNLFVTLTYMEFKTKTNTVDMAIGGHLPTIVIGPDGNVELLNVEEGMPLGLISSDFSQITYKYKPGSIFVLYTDGVTEAMNLKKDMFEEERLVELSKTLKGCSPEEVVKTIHKAVDDFAGKAKQFDDITVMAIKT